MSDEQLTNLIAWLAVAGWAVAVLFMLLYWRKCSQVNSLHEDLHTTRRHQQMRMIYRGDGQ